MQFVDQVSIEVRGGDGGDGCVAFRREKHKPLGGPSGGDGGRGGSVVLRAQGRLSTLLDLRYTRVLEAERGEHGRGKDQYGRGAKDLYVNVPVGTQVFDEASGNLLADLTADGDTFIAANGGLGGRGNMHFATPWERTPRHAEPGTRGEKRRICLELKLLADVGVVGYPNVGKSTFIAAVSKARPKIADYPFTTLVPNLGVASLGPERSFVVADIPGIIEGASEGAGLGLRFLRHVERCRVLLHVVAADPGDGRSLLHDYEVLLRELATFDAELAKRPMIVVVGKMDLPESRDQAEGFAAALERRGIPVLTMSAATHEGTHDVLLALERALAVAPPVERRERMRPKPARRRAPIDELGLEDDYPEDEEPGSEDE